MKLIRSLESLHALDGKGTISNSMDLTTLTVDVTFQLTRLPSRSYTSRRSITNRLDASMGEEWRGDNKIKSEE